MYLIMSWWCNDLKIWDVENSLKVGVIVKKIVLRVIYVWDISRTSGKKEENNSLSRLVKKMHGERYVET